MYRALPNIKTAAAIFPVWLIAGVIIYFAYGYFHKRKLEKSVKIQRFETQNSETAVNAEIK